MAFPALMALRQALLSRLTIGIGGVLALGFTTAQSVRDAMPAASLPVVQAGQPIAAGRWQVTLRQAEVSTTPRPDGYKGRPGTKALSIDLELMNRSSESSNAVARILSFDPPLAGLAPSPTTYLLRDGTILGALQPGLPERVRMVWDLPEAAPVPETIRLLVVGETFKPRDNLLAAPGWFNPKPVATLSLPLRGGGAAP
ncbi:hypothetical protein [Bosea thiooxidans]|nr:hypothetical protein [Bosea thiooxidans]